ncbi:MAG: exodeoxyribonuclease VII large subunit [Clostridiales bacterium]|nr:exodeoxyribonuclease VII large subunit [Clostridiales bacterium]
MKVFSVREINRIIKDLIDNEVILEDIVVTGELSSFSITRDVAYFTLKDTDNLLSCVQFHCKREFLIGDMVECRGNIKYYPKGGKLTFNVLSIQECGQGELYKQFIELKNKLEKEGMFSDLYKIPIPKFVKSIGVVTSKTGAVLQDIKNVVSRRNPSLEIFVYDAQVQGKYAVNDVIQGITYFDNLTDVDVIIVARGGGSLEDLMPFNDEELARVAFICNKPLISAVGHETDFSILDFVSDLRAPTPSAAAEIVTFDKTELINKIKDLKSNFSKNILYMIEEKSYDVKYKLSSLSSSVQDNINDAIMDINEKFILCDKNINTMITNATHCVDKSIKTLDVLNPARLLNKGYSIVTVNDDSINATNVNVGDEIKVIANDVKIHAKVTKKEKRC